METTENTLVKHAELFENLLQSYTQTVELYCRQKIHNAKSREYMGQCLEEQLLELSASQTKETPLVNDAIDFFLDKYYKNEGFDIALQYLRAYYPQTFLHLVPTVKQLPQQIPFSEPEEQLIVQFPNETNHFIRVVIARMVYAEIIVKIPTYLHPESSTKEIKKSAYKWTGSKDNKNEFVQLIYGLHEAGLIENGKGEITKIVESYAAIFNVDLGKHWQSNHSASIHKAKKNYQPPVFDKIKEGYQHYTERQLKSKLQVV
ncbi:MAG: hypothetical protein A3F72_01705 [Bacteroidetes bacterium RIFCSPLOWO2_12_FULL_35_15]|nr:MAG: hypothetical protein A3F72_01705 [Bacteroidetes bacterium RIFCSPLOWO2_12_FULL_35_15]